MTELTRVEAAAALKISPRSLARLVQDPDCPLRPARRRGRQSVWPAREIEAARRWREDRRGEPAPNAIEPPARKPKPRRDKTAGRKAAGRLADRKAEMRIPEPSQPRGKPRRSTPKPPPYMPAMAWPPFASHPMAAAMMGPMLAPMLAPWLRLAAPFPWADPSKLASTPPFAAMGAMNPFWWAALATPRTRT